MYLVLGEELIPTVVNNSFSGNQTNKSTVIINDRNKILIGSPLDQVKHGCGNPYRNIILASGNLHDSAAFRLTHIHIAHIFHCPQQISL